MGVPDRNWRVRDSPARRVKRRRRKIQREIARADLCRQVLELRVRKGLTYEQVGAKLGISLMAAYRAYRSAVAAIPEPIAQEARKESLEHLEFIRSEALRRLSTEPTAYLAILLRVEERRARLLGLDPKTPAVEVNLVNRDGQIPIELARAIARDAALRAKNVTPKPEAATLAPVTPTLPPPEPQEPVEPVASGQMTVAEARRLARLATDDKKDDASPSTGPMTDGAKMQGDYLATTRALRSR